MEGHACGSRCEQIIQLLDNSFRFSRTSYRALTSSSSVIGYRRKSSKIKRSRLIIALIRNCDRINVSFDGTPEIQNKNRPMKNGKDSFSSVHRFLQRCEALGKSTLVRATLMPEDLSRINEIGNFVFKTYPAVSCIQIEPMMPLGRGGALDYQLDQKELYSFADNFIHAVETFSEKYPTKKLVCTLFEYNLQDYYCSASTGAHP